MRATMQCLAPAECPSPCSAQVAMQRKMNEGGALIWIAPSGGRDRPKEDGKWSPDAFDPTAVDLMRNLAQVGPASWLAHDWCKLSAMMVLEVVQMGSGSWPRCSCMTSALVGQASKGHTVCAAPGSVTSRVTLSTTTELKTSVITENFNTSFQVPWQ
jgi:hypothetical protein